MQSGSQAQPELFRVAVSDCEKFSLRSITAARDSASIRAFEKPAVLVVTLDVENAFMHELMVMRTQQHQIFETRFTAS